MTAEVRVLFGPAEIRDAVDRLAAEVSAAHEDGVVLIAVLKGSVIFLADLVRRMTITPVIDFLAVSSYAGLSAAGAPLQSTPPVLSPRAADRTRDRRSGTSGDAPLEREKGRDTWRA